MNGYRLSELTIREENDNNRKDNYANENDKTLTLKA